MESKKFSVKFSKKEKVAKDTYTFYFERPSSFQFISGQYMKMTLSIDNPDERGSSRFFTISSSPTDLDYLTITTRIIRSTFKLKLNSLAPGENIKIFGPIGYFTFDYDQKPKVLLAGGIGVTPFHSLLRYINQKKIKAKIVLIVSFSITEEMVFFDELKEIEKDNSTIKVVYTLTKEDNLYPKLEHGGIDEHMIKNYAQDYKHSDFFITGPEKMVQAIFETVSRMGVAEEKIFKEDFPGY